MFSGRVTVSWLAFVKAFVSFLRGKRPSKCMFCVRCVLTNTLLFPALPVFVKSPTSLLALHICVCASACLSCVCTEVFVACLSCLFASKTPSFLTGFP